MFSITTSGSFKNTESFLQSMMKFDFRRIVEPYAKEGVAALAAATPRDSGVTAESWSYEITGDRKHFTITWVNRDVENGFPVAIMLQYGYGTGTGGYVQGRDYINPAIQPIFDKISNEVWKAVTSA
jgi:hypothetical protein